MKNINLISLILFLFLLTACNSVSISSTRALDKQDLLTKLVDTELYREKESFYFLSGNILMYEDLELRTKTYGSWYVKKIYSSRLQKSFDSICFIRGVTKKYSDSSTRGTCLRLYPKSNNYYLGVYTNCSNILKNNHSIPSCDSYNDYYGYYQISKTKLVD